MSMSNALASQQVMPADDSKICELWAWTDDQRQAVALHVHSIWASWGREWRLGELAQAQLREAHDEIVVGSRHFERANTARADDGPVLYQAFQRMNGAWEGLDDRDAHTITLAIEQCLFGHGTAGVARVGIAAELAAAAWGEFLQRLQKAIESPCVPMIAIPKSAALMRAPEPENPFGGAVYVQLSLNDVSVLLRIPPKVVRRLVEPGGVGTLKDDGKLPIIVAQKAAVSDALKHAEVQIHANLHSVQISLGDLQSLAVGDLLCLNHPLDRPLDIKSADGNVLCHGWLGRSRGHFAVETTLAS